MNQSISKLITRGNQQRLFRTPNELEPQCINIDAEIYSSRTCLKYVKMHILVIAKNHAFARYKFRPLTHLLKLSPFGFTIKE